ncbi:MAG: hypothetical protein CME93_04915 [Hyphomonadaceae bacterium]|nr:hypothetical protein [Hyphomonadaceae bacterium]OUX94708.1 MAG: hypothetical protein CBB77_06490 [Hyphomonas sp. TMED17]CAI8383643.1 MAG: Uncharacterised protein [Hyphomonas sp. TMED17]
MAPNRDKAKQIAEARGRRAENVAALYLRLKGYRILARRAKLFCGEIDLIARRSDTLAFIEVKYRRDHGAGLAAVGTRNWRRISAAAEVWVAGRSDLSNLNWRYDLISIAPGKLPQHERDFWRP